MSFCHHDLRLLGTRVVPAAGFETAPLGVLVKSRLSLGSSLGMTRNGQGVVRVQAAATAIFDRALERDLIPGAARGQPEPAGFACAV
jgi:hypothetical protein